MLSKNERLSIEDAGKGGIYCTIFHSIFASKINLAAVKWNAELYNDRVHNFKLLQRGFNKANLQKTINIEELTKGKTKENLELLQWFYKIYSDNKGVQAEKNQSSGNKGVENEEVKLYKDVMKQLSRKKDFYLSKLESIEYLLERGSASNDIKIQIVKEILYSEADVELEIDNQGDAKLKKLE